MRKILVLVFLAMFCFACAPTKEEVAKQVTDTSRIYYGKDKRTNVCFAWDTSGMPGHVIGFTIVPCEKVEHLIKEKE